MQKYTHLESKKRFMWVSEFLLQENIVLVTIARLGKPIHTSPSQNRKTTFFLMQENIIAPQGTSLE